MHRLDETDRRIISILKENSRMPIRKIADRAGLRPSTVHARLQNLKKEKIIERFSLKLEPKAAGEDFVVFMFLSTTADLPQNFFANRHVKEAYGVTGEHDLIMKLAFADISEFNTYIIALRKNKSIAKTLTYVATISIKDEA